MILRATLYLFFVLSLSGKGVATTLSAKGAATSLNEQSVATTASEQTSATTIVNAGPDFEQFLSQWEHSSDDQKIFDWNAFEEKFSDVYSQVVFNQASPSWPQTKEKAVGEFFRKLPQIKTQMIQIFNKAPEISKHAISSITQIIPNFSPNLTIIYLPSAFQFNGIATSIPSRRGSSVVIGVDTVAARNDNINVLLTHELFHRHHYEEIYKTSAFYSQSAYLWTEGLATYVSGLANPKATLSELLFDTELALACNDLEYVRQLAQKFLKIHYATLTEKEHLEFRREWFWLESQSHPHRPGYCLGYQVAKILAQKYSLDEMIRWGEFTFEDRIAEGLKALRSQSANNVAGKLRPSP